MLHDIADSLMRSSEMLIPVLGHSLWQAAVVAVVVWCSLWNLPARRADLRYGLTACGLGIVVLAAFVTWSVLCLDRTSSSHTKVVIDHSGHDATPMDAGATFNPAETKTAQQSAFEKKRASDSSRTRIVSQAVLIGWATIASMLLIYNLAGIATVRYWAIVSISEFRSELQELESIVSELRQKLNLRHEIPLLLSDCLTAPAVIGTIWPTILIPVSLLSGVPVEQWRIMLAHELAHVRRWDLLVAILQMVVESFLFFNPAVWWLSRQMRSEREACCDAMAAKLCGQPISVARTLVDVAANSLNKSGRATTPVKSASVAFAEPSRQDELSDRVHRLIDPDQFPRSRVSWVSVCSLLILITAFAAITKWSSDVVVRAAVTLITPRQRVEKIVELKVEQSEGKLAPDGTVADPSQTTGPNPMQDGEPPARRIPVELIVRTDDGTPVDSRLHLQSVAKAPSHGWGSTLNGPREPVPVYRTTLYYCPSVCRLGASMPGWATAVSPVMTLRLNDHQAIELVLTKGRTVECALQDEQGRAISNGFTQAIIPVSIPDMKTGTITGDFPSSPEGHFQLEHVGHVTYELQLKAPGFQRRFVSNNFASDTTQYTKASPFILTMKPSRPARLWLRDAMTNQPLPHVRVALEQRQEGSRQPVQSTPKKSDSPNRWSDFGESDEHGLVQLDELEDDVTYTFALFCAGYSVGHVTVTAGAADQTVQLFPQQVISGRIYGKLDRLRHHERNGQMVYVLDFSSMVNNYTNGGSVELDAEGRFSIDVSPGDQISLAVPDGQRRFYVKASITDLQIEIPTETISQLPQREVVIRFTGVPMDAAVRGQLNLYWQHPAAQSHSQSTTTQAVVDNEVRLQIPVGATMNVSGRDLIGYRIQDQSDIKIVEGTDSQSIAIAAYPTGVIHGDVTRADGTLALSAFPFVFAVKLPANQSDFHGLNNFNNSPSPKFLCSVPLGGRYRVFIREQTEVGYAWNISDEITVDEQQPIVKTAVQLNSGKDLAIRLVDPEGHPVARQKVQLSISASVAGSSQSMSFSINADSDATGLTTFRGLSRVPPNSPLRISTSAIVHAGRYRGVTQEIDPLRIDEIHLEQGVTAQGLLVTADGGLPIPNATVRIYPANFQESKYRQSLTTTTNAEGLFRFEGLEPIRYNGMVTDASPRGVVVEPMGGGGYQLHYPNGPKMFELTAGSKEIARWEATIHPGSALDQDH